MSMPYKEVKLTPQQAKQFDVARVAFMQECAFFSHLYYSIGKEVITRDVPMAATDGKHILVNPEYFCSKRVSEQVFILAHEMSHLVRQHPQRMMHYQKTGNIKGKPVVMQWANVCADYIINGDLVESKVGTINPDWLFDKNTNLDEVWEDLYERTLKVIPPPPGGGGSCDQPGGGPGQPTKTAGDGSQPGRGMGKGDPTAKANGGGFDTLLEPVKDPLTGKEDLPDENEFKEAVARAAAVAKARGQMPERLQRMVDELLQAQVDWRDHIRMLMTGKIGSRSETWTRPNRRRLALNPMVVLPGRKGYGCELVVVGVDTSGSVGAAELQAFVTEVSGILSDVKPRRILVIGCDAVVETVEEVHSLDELDALRIRGFKGGGGTYFHPVFDYVKEHNLKPETMVYLTDGMPSRWPEGDEIPVYPVVWAISTDIEPPFGDHVRLKVE